MGCQFSRRSQHSHTSTRSQRSTNRSQPSNITMQSCSVALSTTTCIPTKRIVIPSMVTYESRLQTFATWTGTVQNPEKLAKCGFYYLGEGDKTVCFYCGIGINKWEVQDNPWLEHALHSGSCAFLLLNKHKISEQGFTAMTAAENLVQSFHTQIEKNGPLKDERELMSLQLAENNLCKICLTNEARYLLLPCSHLCYCCDCVGSVETCAICRRRPTAILKVFKS